MTTYASESAVPGGYYLNARRWAVVPVANDGDRLPAGPGTWRRVSVLAALALVPVLGFTFLMALPIIGFVIAATALTTPVLRLLRGGTSDLAATLTPGWTPGEAHLTGREGKGNGGAVAGDARLDALARDILARRHA